MKPAERNVKKRGDQARLKLKRLLLAKANLIIKRPMFHFESSKRKGFISTAATFLLTAFFT